MGEPYPDFCHFPLSRQDQAPDSLSYHPLPSCPQPIFSATYLPPQHHKVDCGLTHKAESRTVIVRKRKFLSRTVKSGDAINTMAIGWATLGFVRKRPILMVAVRLTRHTFGLIEKAEDFTVSVPLSDMAKEIAFCGTKSGRDFDKFKECNLEVAEGRKVTTPLIKTPGLHFECKIVYRSAMDPARLDGEYDTRLYPEKDYHTLSFGEILECYETE